MKLIKWLWSIAFAFLVVLAYATLTSFFLTPYSDWYLALPKPEATPTPALISIGWTINYIVTIVLLSRAIYSRHNNSTVITAVLIGIFNIVWSVCFFTFHRLVLSFIMQLIITLLSVLLWWQSIRRDALSGLLYLPGLFWVVYVLITGYNLLLFNL